MDYSAALDISSSGKHFDNAKVSIDPEGIKNPAGFIDYADIIRFIAKAGVPVLQKVVAMFIAIWPALPMPELISLPPRRFTCSTIRSTARP